LVRSVVWVADMKLTAEMKQSVSAALVAPISRPGRRKRQNDVSPPLRVRQSRYDTGIRTETEHRYNTQLRTRGFRFRIDRCLMMTLIDPQRKAAISSCITPIACWLAPFGTLRADTSVLESEIDSVLKGSEQHF
jgi:hypothetical protein